MYYYKAYNKESSAIYYIKSKKSIRNKKDIEFWVSFHNVKHWYEKISHFCPISIISYYLKVNKKRLHNYKISLIDLDIVHYKKNNKEKIFREIYLEDLTNS